MLTETQKQFIFKRTLFQKVSGYIAWSIGVSTATAWALMYWLKPEMVNPQAVLGLIRAKTESGVDMSQLTDIAVLAVTGASAISAVFFLLIFLAYMMTRWTKKEKQFLDIISQLEKKSD